MSTALQSRRFRQWTTGAFVALAFIMANCLGTLQHEARAEQIAVSPRSRLNLPIHENRPHWLLRREEGWIGAHKVRFGGDPDDPNVVIVRAAIFRDEQSARAAYAIVTPEYLYALWRSRMAAVPEPFSYPRRIPGDEVRVVLYELKRATDDGAQAQITVLRRGHVVIVIESIGVPPEQLIPAVDDVQRAAESDSDR